MAALSRLLRRAGRRARYLGADVCTWWMHRKTRNIGTGVARDRDRGLYVLEIAVESFARRHCLLSIGYSPGELRDLAARIDKVLQADSHHPAWPQAGEGHADA